MSANRNRDCLVGLVRELRNLPHETEWAEFKVNYRDPQTTGEYVSALSNAAALNEKANGYILWGVEDGTHDIVGTAFSPAVENSWPTRSFIRTIASRAPGRW